MKNSIRIIIGFIIGLAIGYGILVGWKNYQSSQNNSYFESCKSNPTEECKEWLLAKMPDDPDGNEAKELLKNYSPEVIFQMEKYYENLSFPEGVDGEYRAFVVGVLIAFIDGFKKAGISHAGPLAECTIKGLMEVYGDKLNDLEEIPLNPEIDARCYKETRE